MDDAIIIKMLLTILHQLCQYLANQFGLWDLIVTLQKVLARNCNKLKFGEESVKRLIVEDGKYNYPFNFKTWYIRFTCAPGAGNNFMWLRTQSKAL